MRYSNEEEAFLAGPRARWRELKYVFGVAVQFVRGLRAFHFLGPTVTIYGSARFKEDHPYYKKAQEIAGELAKLGFTIITGGGPGIMEAANRGAKENGGLSIGCNIVLPKEQYANPYLDKYVNIDYFFVRKELLRKYSFAFVVMPGGFGTLDEFFETLTLIQTKKIRPFPIVVFDKEFHKDLLGHIEYLKEQKTIDPADMDLILFTDSIKEATDYILEYAKNNTDIKLTSKYSPMWILGENRTKVK